jgi:type IV secretory pathway TrbL component
VLLLQRLLLLPLLAPLLVVVLVGAINPRPLVALRLLTWTSPTLSIGLWLSIAAGGGAAISAAATGLALRLGPGARSMPTGRQANRQTGRPTNHAVGPDDEIWPDGERQAKGPAQGPAKGQSKERSNGPSRNPFQAGPSRAPGDPAPTVAVPFRVIRKAPTASAPPSHAPEAKATAVGDGWDQAASDDW